MKEITDPGNVGLTKLCRIFLALSSALLIFSCNRLDQGEKLAQKHCANCHKYAGPELLDTSTWKNSVLPEMKFRMGLDMGPLWKLPAEEVQTISRTLQRARLTEKEWKKIETFYLERAPASLDPIHTDDDTLRQFNFRNISSEIPPMLTFIQYEEKTKRFMAGTRNSRLFFLNINFKQDTIISLSSPPSACITINSDSLHVLEMGKMDPNDLFNGKLTALNLSRGERPVLIDSLNRPVHFMEDDFDRDGDSDILISCFGNFIGSLLLYENLGNSFTKHSLHNFPGNIRTVLRDVNNDGLLDIFALTTQGNEQILLLVNEGNLRFTQQVLHRFPPVYGSSYFDLRDMDGDGDEDIIYANGDNSDYSTILKPYHGIRILENDGSLTFTETQFFPMHGAYRFETEDFDKDGDIDIAAIAFFNDFENSPERSFVYLENTKGRFKSSTASGASVGRWLVMESIDVSGDGFPDLILGALNFTAGIDKATAAKWNTYKTPFLLLENVGLEGGTIHQ